MRVGRNRPSGIWRPDDSDDLGQLRSADLAIIRHECRIQPSRRRDYYLIRRIFVHLLGDLKQLDHQGGVILRDGVARMGTQIANESFKPVRHDEMPQLNQLGQLPERYRRHEQLGRGIFEKALASWLEIVVGRVDNDVGIKDDSQRFRVSRGLRFSAS